MKTKPRVSNLVVWLQSNVPTLSPNAKQKHLLKSMLPRVSITFCATEASFRKALPKADAVLVWRFDDTFLPKAERLRWIFTPAAGREDIRLSNPPKALKVVHGDFHGPLIAQSVVGALLAINRGIIASDRARFNGEKWLRQTCVVQDISETQAIIYGYGRIGKSIARHLAPFGISTVGVRRTPHKDCVTPDELPKVLPMCDHLILALPSDTGTDKVINAQLLRQLPKHAVIYNIGRGNCIDEAALLEALRSDRLAGAYLDVFAHEPLPPNSPLYDEPRLLLTSHISALAPTYLDRWFDQVTETLSRAHALPGPTDN